MNSVKSKDELDEGSEKIFSESKIAILAELVGIKRRRINTFGRMLEEAGQRYYRERARKSRVAPGKIVRHFEQIEATCKKLNHLIDFDQQSPLYEQVCYSLQREAEAWRGKYFPDPDEPEILRSKVVEYSDFTRDAPDWFTDMAWDITFLGLLSVEAQKRFKAEKSESRDRNRGDLAINTLIERLCWICWELEQIAPTVSYDPIKKTTGGRLVKFVAECLNAMKKYADDTDDKSSLSLSRHAIGTRIRRSWAYMAARGDDMAEDVLVFLKVKSTPKNT